mgnify:FL=1
MNKMSKISTVLVASLLTVSLTACSGTDDASNETVSTAPETTSSSSAKPSNADEAAKQYQDLMQQENDILSANSDLWEKVFASVDKDNPMIGKSSNYGDFLLAAIDDAAAAGKLSDEETETLKTGAQQVKEIEDQLAALEQDYPGCGSTPGAGESVDAASAGMTADSSEQTAFPSFTGKDFDGNDVSSDELFSKNKVTVVNFWFSTCKPCVEELGDLDALNKELAEKGGEVVGVNSYTLDGDETAISDAKDILSKKGATYRNIWFGSDTEAGQFTAGLFSFPTTYVVDQNGNIVGQPIMGGIASAEQKDALNKLIDQAIANSAE